MLDTITTARSGFDAARAWDGIPLATLSDAEQHVLADHFSAQEDAAVAAVIATRARTEAELSDKAEVLRELLLDGIAWSDRRELKLMEAIVADAQALGLIP